jgi:hypothetical protein
MAIFTILLLPTFKKAHKKEEPFLPLGYFECFLHLGLLCQGVNDLWILAQEERIGKCNEPLVSTPFPKIQIHSLIFFSLL